MSTRYIFTDADGSHYYTHEGTWVPVAGTPFASLWNCLDRENANATAKAIRRAGIKVKVKAVKVEWNDRTGCFEWAK